MHDREKVLNGLKHCSDPDRCDADCPYYKEYNEVSDCESLLAGDALELLQEQEWISVKDRLPNCNGCYIVWRPHFYPDKGMPSICYFDGQNTWHDSYGVDFTRTLASEDVSHWMPLPKPPEEVSAVNEKNEDRERIIQMIKNPLKHCWPDPDRDRELRSFTADDEGKRYDEV